MTITRPSEAANAQWNEIDFDKSLWNIPAERMKMKKAFTIPLSPQVLKILNKLKNISGRSRFIFKANVILKDHYIQALPMQQLNALVIKIN